MVGRTLLPLVLVVPNHRRVILQKDQTDYMRGFGTEEGIKGKNQQKQTHLKQKGVKKYENLIYYCTYIIPLYT